jgi:hypothetical protein
VRWGNRQQTLFECSKGRTASRRARQCKPQRLAKGLDSSKDWPADSGKYTVGEVLYVGHQARRGFTTIEIDTLEYQQTEKIETELKDVNRIRANRCTQLCPGSPSGASHSHNTIYYSFPADSPPSRKEAPRWRVLYRITRQLLHRARCGSFSQKIETAS